VRDARSRLRLPAHAVALAVRPRIAGDPQQRAPDALARFPGLSLQARELQHRRGAGGTCGLSLGAAIRVRQSRAPVVAPIWQRAADADAGRAGEPLTSR